MKRLNLFSQYKIFIYIFIIVIVFFICIILLSTNIVDKLPCVPGFLKSTNQINPTKIFDSNKQVILSIGGHKTIKLKNTSTNFLKAIIATEDHKFWKHNGINKFRTLKAICITFFVPTKIQGASTITQQLVKNLFFSFEKTYVRKFKELLISIQIEKQFSKQKILEIYINQIHFGSNTHGIEQASEIFFGKSASNLNLSESSLLAGLPKSPTRYNPHKNPSKAKKRQMIVLKRMFYTKMITNNQLKNAYAKPLQYRKRNNEWLKIDNYFIDTVIKYLKKQYGSELIYHGDLNIYTTMDSSIQNLAEMELEHGLLNLENNIKPYNYSNNYNVKNLKLQGAIVSIDVNSGAIRAIVGGRTFHETPYNRAIQNNRQPGSGFKPFLYYAAFKNGNISPIDVLIDKKISICISDSNIWEPRNFGRRCKGPMIIKKAFIDSVNTIAAQLIKQIGPKAVINAARRCGIKSTLNPVYSVALGTSGVSPLEMASAFSTFASGGIRRESHIICSIENTKGYIIEKHIVNPKIVLDPNFCYQLIDMMRGVVNIGPGKAIRKIGFNLDAAGKTGTTSSYNDAWFTGFTPNLSTSVWIGFDKYYGMEYKNGYGVTGGTGAVPIWTNFMLKVVKETFLNKFPIPNNITFNTVNPETGKNTNLLSNNSLKVALIKKKQYKKKMSREKMIWENN